MAVGEKFKRKGTHVYVWLIHLVVWQKPTQHCEAIILQLKKNLFCLKINMHEILTHNHGKMFNFSWKFPSSLSLNLNYHKEKKFFFLLTAFWIKEKAKVKKQLFNFLRHEISMFFLNSVKEVFYSGEYFQSLQNLKVKVKVAQSCPTLCERVMEFSRPEYWSG